MAKLFNGTRRLHRIIRRDRTMVSVERGIADLPDGTVFVYVGKVRGWERLLYRLARLWARVSEVAE